MTTDALPAFCTLAEWAERFGYSTYTAQQYARTGKIPAVKVGSRWFVNLKVLAEQMGRVAS